MAPLGALSREGSSVLYKFYLERFMWYRIFVWNATLIYDMNHMIWYSLIKMLTADIKTARNQKQKLGKELETKTEFLRRKRVYDRKDLWQRLVVSEEWMKEWGSHEWSVVKQQMQAYEEASQRQRLGWGWRRETRGGCMIYEWGRGGTRGVFWEGYPSPVEIGYWKGLPG